MTSFACVAAIGNLSEQAGFALKKNWASLGGVLSFLGKVKERFHLTLSERSELHLLIIRMNFERWMFGCRECFNVFLEFCRAQLIG